MDLAKADDYPTVSWWVKFWILFFPFVPYLGWQVVRVVQIHKLFVESKRRIHNTLRRERNMEKGRMSHLSIATGIFMLVCKENNLSHPVVPALNSGG